MFKRAVIGMTVAMTTMAMLMVAVGTGQAGAATRKGTMTGPVVVTVTSTLNPWPCNTSCQGTIASGTATGADVGTFTGDGTKNPKGWINLCVNCPVTGMFNYQEACIASEPFPLIGTAQGQLFIGQGPSVKANIVGDMLQPKVGMSETKVDFTWTRVGAIAVVQTGKLAGPNKWKTSGQKTKSWKDGKMVSDTVGDVAVAVLVPTAPLPPPGCGHPGSLTVMIPGIDINVA